MREVFNANDAKFRSGEAPDLIANLLSNGDLLLTGISEEGKLAMDEKIDDGAPMWGNGVYIEGRYWEPLKGALEDEGLFILETPELI